MPPKNAHVGFQPGYHVFQPLAVGGPDDGTRPVAGDTEAQSHSSTLGARAGHDHARLTAIGGARRVERAAAALGLAGLTRRAAGGHRHALPGRRRRHENDDRFTGRDSECRSERLSERAAWRPPTGRQVNASMSARRQRKGNQESHVALSAAETEEIREFLVVTMWTDVQTQPNLLIQCGLRKPVCNSIVS